MLCDACTLTGCFAAVSTVRRICEDELEKGGYKFFCPALACDLELTVAVVRHILSVVMSREELNAMLDRMNENYINRPDTDIRRCAVCTVNWQRDFTKRWPGHRNRGYATPAPGVKEDRSSIVGAVDGNGAGMPTPAGTRTALGRRISYAHWQTAARKPSGMCTAVPPFEHAPAAVL